MRLVLDDSRVQIRTVLGKVLGLSMFDPQIGALSDFQAQVLIAQAIPATDIKDVLEEALEREADTEGMIADAYGDMPYDYDEAEAMGLTLANPNDESYAGSFADLDDGIDGFPTGEY